MVPTVCSLSVIIPAFNERKRLPLTLIAIDDRLSRSGYSYEILVVNDGSTDDTAEVVSGFSAFIKKLRLIDNVIHRGKGAAVKQGTLEAIGDYFLFIDADHAVSIDHIDQAILYLHNGYDLVIGSKYIPGAKVHPRPSRIKYFLSTAGNMLIRLLFCTGIRDTQCGFKCFTNEAARKIFPYQRVNGWGFDVEILALAGVFGFKIKEMPVIVRNSIDTKVRPVSYIKVLLEVLTIRWLLWRDVYKVNDEQQVKQ